MSKGMLKELDQENINYRIQLGDIAAHCQREIVIAERNGDDLRVSFAKRILKLAELKEDKEG